MNNRVEDQLDKMINDLNAVNDDFVNDYFEEESPLNIKSLDEIEDTVENNEHLEENNDSEQTSSIESSETDIEEPNDWFIPSEEENIEVDPKEIAEEPVYEESKEEKTFSYSDILSRLDTKKDVDLDNPSDILDLIENSTNSDDFFEAIEKENIDD